MQPTIQCVFLAYFDIPKIHFKAKICGVFTFILFNFEVQMLQCAENPFYICFDHENIKKMPSNIAYFAEIAIKVEKILKGSLVSIPSPSVKIQIMGGNKLLLSKVC